MPEFQWRFPAVIPTKRCTHAWKATKLTRTWITKEQKWLLKRKESSLRNKNKNYNKRLDLCQSKLIYVACIFLVFCSTRSIFAFTHYYRLDCLEAWNLNRGRKTQKASTMTTLYIPMMLNIASLLLLYGLSCFFFFFFSTNPFFFELIGKGMGLFHDNTNWSLGVMLIYRFRGTLSHLDIGACLPAYAKNCFSWYLISLLYFLTSTFYFIFSRSFCLFSNSWSKQLAIKMSYDNVFRSEFVTDLLYRPLEFPFEAVSSSVWAYPFIVGF